MAANEKFCLKWNDFEHNVSSSFNDIREEKDFFDVTLVCDNNQIEAHKVIIGACSPFFRTILRRNPHQHPLLYLKGVLYDDLVSVLNFMYRGEVNIAQEQLNSFLAVAEDLQVKGLTQDGRGSGRTGAKSEASRAAVSNKNYPPAAAAPPQVKSARVGHSSAGMAAASSSQLTSYVDTGAADDDIQEVIPVKTEPPAHHLLEPHQAQGVVAPMEDDNYVEEGYEGYDDQQYQDYANTGDTSELSKDIETAIAEKMYKNGGLWYCNDCDYKTPNKSHCYEHVEAKHIVHGGYTCPICGKILKTSGSYRVHQIKSHPQQ